MLLQKASTSEGLLYLTLYARLKDPQTYHYALHISPKEESLDPNVREMTKFHCKNIIRPTVDAVTMPWIYEAVQVNSNFDDRILVRVLLGEVRRVDLSERLFAEVPVIQNDPTFNCVTWVHHALLQLMDSTIVRTSTRLHWDNIQRTTLDYVNTKKQQGRFETGWDGDSSRVPTVDMEPSREIFE